MKYKKYRSQHNQSQLSQEIYTSLFHRNRHWIAFRYPCHAFSNLFSEEIGRLCCRPLSGTTLTTGFTSSACSHRIIYVPRNPPVNEIPFRAGMSLCIVGESGGGEM